MVKVIEIKMEKDLREENILERDLQGNPIRFKQSEFICRVFFDNGTSWTPEFPELEKIWRLIVDNEDYKYPNGRLKRNMPLYKYIFPIWEYELLLRGFNPEWGLMELADIEKRQKKKIEEKESDKGKKEV